MAHYIKKTIQEMESDAYYRANSEALVVEQVNDLEYLVSNLEHLTNYIVKTEEGVIVSCECPHHIYRKVLCKHLVKVAYETGLEII